MRGYKTGMLASLPKRVACALLVAACSAGANADVKTWSNVGNIGGPVLWVAGLGSSLLQDGSQGKEHAARTLDGLVVAGLLSEGLQFATHEPRPYTSGHDSFPSDHATLSFAVAAAQSYYHPRQALLWYGAASVISYARVAGHEHHPQDVIAGAALGFAVGRLAVTSRRGWVFGPMFSGDGAGVELTYSH